MKPDREIVGKAIILRAQRSDDAKYYAHWFNDPKVMFQCGFRAAAYVARMALHGSFDHNSGSGNAEQRIRNRSDQDHAGYGF